MQSEKKDPAFGERVPLHLVSLGKPKGPNTLFSSRFGFQLLSPIPLSSLKPWLMVWRRMQQGRAALKLGHQFHC